MNEEQDNIKVSAAEDERLIRAFHEGEKYAFDHLVVKHKNRLFGLCYWLTGNYEEADDCAQDAFVKAYRALGKFRFESSFSTWLYRIAVNTCKNRVASSSFRHAGAALRIGGSDSNNCGLAREITDSAPSQAKVIDRKEKSELIQAAIARLPEEQKTVVVLRDVEGLLYDEIARITGYNPGTVRSRLARARQTLKEQLKGLI